MAEAELNLDLNAAAKSRGFLPPRVVHPPNAAHTHTLIVLHGRGSNADTFAAGFLSARLSKPPTRHARNSSSVSNRDHQRLLGGCFPGARYVFPTARTSIVAASGRARVSNQWFDVWDLRRPDVRPELQHDGLRETVDFLRAVVRCEAALVGARNVVIVGLSQGCAVGLHLLMGLEVGVDLPPRHRHGCPGDGEQRDGTGIAEAGRRSRKKSDPQHEEGTGGALGGFIGMSGWFPLASDVARASFPEEVDDDGIWRSPAEEFRRQKARPGAHVAAANDAHILRRQYGAVNYVREVAGLPATEPSTARSPSFVRCPCFIGHGTLDGTVPFTLGERVRDLLVRLRVPVTWASYEWLHWWKEPDEIDAIAEFLRDEVGMVMEE